MTERRRVDAFSFYIEFEPQVCFLCQKRKNELTTLTAGIESIRSEDKPVLQIFWEYVCRQCALRLMRPLLYNDRAKNVTSFRSVGRNSILSRRPCDFCLKSIHYTLNVKLSFLKGPQDFVVVDNRVWYIDNTTRFSLCLCQKHTRPFLPFVSVSNFIDYIKGGKKT
jgi:hypothetical protein